MGIGISRDTQKYRNGMSTGSYVTFLLYLESAAYTAVSLAKWLYQMYTRMA